MQTPWKRNRSRVVEAVLNLLALSLVFAVLMIPIPLITEDPWWVSPVLGFLLAVTFSVVTFFKDGLKDLGEQRAQARREGAGVEDRGLVRRLIGWSADHRQFVYLTLGTMLIITNGWLRAGFKWAALMLAGVVVVLIISRFVTRLRAAK